MGLNLQKVENHSFTPKADNDIHNRMEMVT